MANDYPPVNDAIGDLLRKWMEVDIINFERVYVTGFAKIDLMVIFSILRNTNLNY